MRLKEYKKSELTRLVESAKSCNFSRSGRTDKGVSAFEQVFALDLRSQCAATDVPADVYETWLRDQAGSSAQQWWWIQTWLASTGVVALLIFVICLFIATREAVYVSLGASSFLLSIAWLMSRTAGYQRVQQARRDYHQAYPDFVVRLR